MVGFYYKKIFLKKNLKHIFLKWRILTWNHNDLQNLAAKLAFLLALNLGSNYSLFNEKYFGISIVIFEEFNDVFVYNLLSYKFADT